MFIIHKRNEIRFTKEKALQPFVRNHHDCSKGASNSNPRRKVTFCELTIADLSNVNTVPILFNEQGMKFETKWMESAYL
jgi:hypothetical protein